jgi:integrase
MPSPTNPKRRTKTKFPGIYKSSSGRYEIAYRNSDNALVFKTIGDLEAAKAARARIVTRLDNGEEIRANRQSLGAFADGFLADLNRRERTVEKHERNLRCHLVPRFGRRQLFDLRTSDVASLVAEMQRAGYAGSTISGTLGTLSLVCRKARVRNPVADLERDDRPTVESPDKRILEQEEIELLLKHTGEKFRPLVAVLVFTGLRLGEALGLRWSDIDFENGVVHVRHQLSRRRQLVEVKTRAARRDVVLLPALARVVREHKLASLYAQEGDYVFASPDGRGRDHRSTSKGIERAVERAGLGAGISAHSFRHTFASLLIVELKYEAVSVAKQLGHTRPSFTLDTYSHLFAKHENELRDALEQNFGHLLDGNAVSTGGVNRTQSQAPEPAQISAFSG